MTPLVGLGIFRQKIYDRGGPAHLSPRPAPGPCVPLWRFRLSYTFDHEQWQRDEDSLRNAVGRAEERAFDETAPDDVGKRLDIIIALLFRIVDQGVPRQ